MVAAPSLIYARQLPATTGPRAWAHLTELLLSAFNFALRGAGIHGVLTHAAADGRFAKPIAYWRGTGPAECGFLPPALGPAESMVQFALATGFVGFDVESGRCE